MKLLLLLVLTVFSVSAFAEFQYSCDMYPGQQGGNLLLIRVEGNRAKVFSISPSEQNARERFLTTLRLISKKNSHIKHYVEKQEKDGLEFFIRRGAGAVGRSNHHTNEFSFYSCSYGESWSYED